MKTLLVTIITCALLAPQLVGQENRLERADKKFEEYAYVDARKIYVNLAKKGYESPEIFKKIADSYYFNGEYEDAASWLQKFVDKYPNDVTAEYYFRFAQSLRAINDYEGADKMMNAFRAVRGDDGRSELFEKNPNYLTNISYRKSKYDVTKIRSINSIYSDFGTTEYEGKLVFASARDTGGFTRSIHKWNNQPFLDLYSASFVNSDSIVEVNNIKPFDGLLNTKFHESTSTFNKDGDVIFFTRNNYNDRKFKKAKSGTNKLKIYTSRRVGGSWTLPTEVPFNSDEYSTAHPTLNEKGDKLYFASDMPGTIGESDIWEVDIDSTFKVVGEPRNLGRPVNTEGRESFPYSSKRGNLYFASDGHPGLGGLDVFVTTPDDGITTSDAVENLGESLNGSYDDFSFIVNDSTLVGYFSSNRKRGRGSDDIYRFTKEELAPECDIFVEGLITDKETGEPIPDATVNVLSEEREVLRNVTTDEDGNYRAPLDCNTEYVIQATKEGYGPAEALFDTPGESGTVKQDLQLKFELIEVGVGDDLSELLNLNPIYFDLDRFNIRPDAALELEKVFSVMEQFPNMVIDIRSHTDSRGSANYNRRLSDKRAKATVGYLIDQGIERGRVTGEGYGESQLINRCADRVECSDEEHQANRRSEFIVISFK